MSTIMIVLLSIAALVALYVLITFNTLVKRKTSTENSFSEIDVFLSMRNDLIPNLVNITSAYVKHEEDLFEKLTLLRVQTLEKKIPTNKKVILDNTIIKKLNQANTIYEKYPELKANQHFLQVQKEIIRIENELQATRRTYNAWVTSYNTLLQQFPSSIVGKLFGFKTYTLFEINEN